MAHVAEDPFGVDRGAAGFVDVLGSEVDTGEPAATLGELDGVAAVAAGNVEEAGAGAMARARSRNWTSVAVISGVMARRQKSSATPRKKLDCQLGIRVPLEDTRRLRVRAAADSYRTALCVRGARREYSREYSPQRR